MQPKVSLCMIVRNEEAHLPACLATAADLVDEIVIVDTGSTDRTKEAAASFGARIFDFPWIDDFSAARNETLRHATGKWIFWLDADDRIDETNRQRLRALFASLSEEKVAFLMKCLIRAGGGESATVVDHTRLFPNHPEVRWCFRIHEQVQPALQRLRIPARQTDIVIEHLAVEDSATKTRKLERNLALLNLQLADDPDNAVFNFYLGLIYYEIGRIAEASMLFRRSLERRPPGDAILRKLYLLIAICEAHLGRPQEAFNFCRAGRQLYPHDSELLFQESILRRDLGDLIGAEACLVELLRAPTVAPSALSGDVALRGYKARNNLARMCREQRRDAEAETLWREALAEQPNFRSAWLGLGDLYLSQGRWEELEQVIRSLDADPQGAVDAATLRGLQLLARGEFNAARSLLEQAIAQSPRSLGPRVVLSQVLVQEGRDPAATERALRDVLALDPGHVGARQNLAMLLQQYGQMNSVIVAG